jgi:hypothetical protein
MVNNHGVTSYFIICMLRFLLHEVFFVPLLVGLLTIGNLRECNFQICWS